MDDPNRNAEEQSDTANPLDTETDRSEPQRQDPPGELEYTEEELATMEAIRAAQRKYGQESGTEQGAGDTEDIDEATMADMDPILAAGYGGMPDEQVVEKCHEGDSLAMEYLLNKYKNFVRSKARSYFLIGADHEDIVQEGMIGLFKAIRDFRPDKLASFRAFAELCITRQIITAIKTATRQKHIPLNSYVSLNKPIYDEESDRTLMDIIVEGHVDNPEELIISQEDLHGINKTLAEMLSDLEKDALNLYLDGKSYVEIAEELGRHAKSIDNALQRVKRKLEKYLKAKRHEEAAV